MKQLVLMAALLTACSVPPTINEVASPDDLTTPVIVVVKFGVGDNVIVTRPNGEMATGIVLDVGGIMIFGAQNMAPTESRAYLVDFTTGLQGAYIVPEFAMELFVE